MLLMIHTVKEGDMLLTYYLGFSVNICVPKAVLFGTDPPGFVCFCLFFIQLLVMLSIACVRPDMHCQWVSGVMGG